MYKVHVTSFLVHEALTTVNGLRPLLVYGFRSSATSVPDALEEEEVHRAPTQHVTGTRVRPSLQQLQQTVFFACSNVK